MHNKPLSNVHLKSLGFIGKQQAAFLLYFVEQVIQKAYYIAITAWFLRIALSVNVSMRVCVCPLPRLLITSGVMQCDIDPISLVKQVLWLLYSSCSRYHQWAWPKHPHVSWKLVLCKSLFCCKSCLKQLQLSSRMEHFSDKVGIVDTRVDVNLCISNHLKRRWLGLEINDFFYRVLALCMMLF